MTKQEIIITHVREARTINGLYEMVDLLRDMVDAGHLEGGVFVDVLPSIMEKVGEFGRLRAGKEYDEGRAIK